MPNDPGELHDALAVVLDCPPDASADELQAVAAKLSLADARLALAQLIELTIQPENSTDAA